MIAAKIVLLNQFKIANCAKIFNFETWIQEISVNVSKVISYKDYRTSAKVFPNISTIRVPPKL